MSALVDTLCALRGPPAPWDERFKEMMVRRSGTIGVGVAAAVLLAAPAFASSTSYAFTANFKYRLDSDSWSQGAGSDTWHFNCTSGSGESYTVTLYKNKTFQDQNEGSKNFTCNNTADSGTWSGLDSGKYHFTLSKGDDGKYVVGSGSVSHPAP